MAPIAGEIGLTRSLILAAGLWGLVSCAAPPPPPAAPAPAPPAAASPAPRPAAAPSTPSPETATEPVQVATEVQRTTAWGATYTVPAGWFVQARPDHVRFQDPDRELTLVLAEIEGDRTSIAPGSLFALLGRSLPARERNRRHDRDVGGWDEALEVHWETPQPEVQVLAVNARRKGRRIWATLLEGTQAAFARRGAQVRQVVLGLKAPGVEEEDLASKGVQPLDGERARQLAAFVEQVRQKTRVPGVAVAVVQGGKVVMAEGFGEKAAGSKEKVTPRTRFMIGSVTKSLSSLLIAHLVDEGKVRWDSKVAALDPRFGTGDPAFTARLTLADTFCACTGMPRRDLDFIFEYAASRPEDVIAWFKSTRPTTGFGETFQYSNQMTALGGFVAARLAEPKLGLEQAYVRALEKRIFRPLGMKDSTASYQAGRRGAASPHSVSLASPVVGDPLRLPWAMESFVRPVAPAGSVFSTALDMARYALFELARGRSQTGQQVVSEANVLERRRPRVKASAQGSYGLGLGVGKRNGLTVVSHDGGTFGFVTRMLLIPERDLGLVVLSNSSGAGALLIDAISQRLVELVLGAKERAATELDRALARRLREGSELQSKVRAKVPPEVAARLKGGLEAPRLGQVRIAPAAGELWADVGEWKSRLGYTRTPDGTERLFLLDPPLVGMPLRVAASGSGGAAAPELVVDFGQDVFRFRRR